MVRVAENVTGTVRKAQRKTLLFPSGMQALARCVFGTVLMVGRVWGTKARSIVGTTRWIRDFCTAVTFEVREDRSLGY